MAVCICIFFNEAKGQNLLRYVQPLSGTAPSTTLAAQKHIDEASERNANTIPAVGLPFAMTQWTPQTRLTENKCIPPYFYRDSLLTGFRATHWLSGSCTQDYGSFTIMPLIGKLQPALAQTGIPFSHTNETTSPSYYRLDLPGLRTEITATLRCGLMQFTMMQDDSLYLLVTPNSDFGEANLQIDEISGNLSAENPVHRIYQGWGSEAGFSGFMWLQTAVKPACAGLFVNDTVLTGTKLFRRAGAGAYLGYKLKKGNVVCLQMGTSFTSASAARNNLQREVGNSDFTAVLSAVNKAWQTALSQVAVTTTDEKDKRVFYTAMYHAMQHPRLYNDVDGSYPKFSGNREILTTHGAYYDDFSMWDICRAQLPLMEILQPEKVNDFVVSLVDKGTQGGWLPIFPCWNSYTAAMIGDHATVVIASAFAKGISRYNIQEAYRLMRQNAFNVADSNSYKNGNGRRALSSYLQYGYIPLEDTVPYAFHKREQVSRTMEYAYDDYALSIVAKKLQKQNDAALLQQRANNFKYVLDTAVKKVRGRYSNGSWYQPFNPDSREPYITEGTPAQYSFYAPQNIPLLQQLMGGDHLFEQALDNLFAKGEYWHGNEPGHQVPFLYNYTNAPYKTQARVRKILAEEYSDNAGGLSGNDDAGQMSAWYIFAAIGFYPVDPVSGNYQLCSPLFNKVQIRLKGNKTFTVKTTGNLKTDIYIQSVTLNGKPNTKNYIRYSDIMQGGELIIQLQNKPGSWGALPVNRAPVLY